MPIIDGQYLMPKSLQTTIDQIDAGAQLGRALDEPLPLDVALSRMEYWNRTLDLSPEGHRQLRLEMNKIQYELFHTGGMQQ
jgi:hypothetical protein